ncbi:hypothetical protein H5410_001391 [Solanum commersonii]|uniref:Uncharacterized protein n=1 Tax=Solanum commersonii TaxID=4109 RepID=A0A9J6AZF1_SOLCO|nr:hypothetical protein H5410_001391 [Solanum commersonii]
MIINLASNMYLDYKSLMNIAFMCLNMEILDVSSCTNHTEADNCPRINHIGEGTALFNLEVISAVGSTLNDGPGHDWKYMFSPVEMKLGELRSDNRGLTCTKDVKCP